MMSSLDNMINSLSLTEMAGQIWEIVGMELCLFVTTCLGFYIFRSEKVQQLMFPNSNKPKKVMSTSKKVESDPDTPLAKEMEKDFAAGNFDGVLKAWPDLQNVTVESLKLVVRSLLELRKQGEMQEILQTMLDLNSALRSAWAMNQVLAIVSPKGMTLGLQVFDIFAGTGVSANDATFESILGGLKDSTPEHITEVTSHMKINMTARVYSLLVKGAIKSKRVERALHFVTGMHDAGHSIPPSCLGLMFRSAGELGCVEEMMETLPAAIAYPPEAIAAVLEHAQKTSDMELLKCTQKKALRENIQLNYACYEALMKAYASQGDPKAVALFDEVLEKGFDPSEGSAISIVTLCAESKHVQMAERVVDYAKEKGRASLALYSALMKVYACSRLFNKTCDLYESCMVKEKLDLDTVAYGCLIKAAVESGRLELARKLFQQSGNPDLLNYMSLIRAAGREKNARKALDLLKELEQSPIEVDTTCYNCVLDVCVACGENTMALELFERMKEVDRLDVISYNTLLKLLMKQGSWAKVEVVLEEMRGRGLKPNVVTYNSLINAFISNGDMASAWRYLEDMETYGVAMDAYTCSIMMKGLKHSSRKEDMDRILALMDKAKVVPDEVLMNTLLDACVRLRDPRRLNNALNQFKASGVVPSMHANAVLIKAYGHAHRLDQAWKVWRELMHERKTHPNEEVYCAMIDACVHSDDLDAASKLFVEMRKQIPNSSKGTMIFSSLVKGFTQRKEMDRAMELYEKVSDAGACNLVTYNTLIDIYARVGDMDKVSKMFRDMCDRGVDPDLITYSTVIKGYCVQGDLEQAIQLYNMMWKRGITPDGILFNSILDGCARKQMRTLTEKVLGDMEEAKVAPSNFTLSILVKLYGRLGDLDRAFKVVETYPAKYGFDLNATVYTCLMSSCMSNDDAERALKVFDKMKSSKCAPDLKTYMTLVNGCLRKDKLEAAVKLVDEAMGLGNDAKKCDGSHALLDRETIENVLFVLNRRQKSQELGAPLMERLRKAGMEVSPRASSNVGRSAAQNLGSSSRFHAKRGGWN